MVNDRKKIEKYFAKNFEIIGVDDYDYCYIYSDFRWFAYELGKNLEKNDFCSAVISPLLDKKKTIVIPTYTYTTEGIFEVTKTPTHLGALNSWILQQPKVCRSEHPLFSFGAIGTRANLVENCGKSAFGERSVHERLRNKRTCIIHIGKPIHLANTIIHHVEQACGATYRINKAFRTKVYRNEKYLGTDYNAFVRRRNVKDHDFHFDLKRATDELYKSDIVHEVGDPKKLSNITLCDYDEVRNFFVESFLKDHSIFLSKEFVGYED